MQPDRARTIAALRESVRSLQRLLETERRIAEGTDPDLVARARSEIPRLEALIAEGEARIAGVEALPPLG